MFLSSLGFLNVTTFLYSQGEDGCDNKFQAKKQLEKLIYYKEEVIQDRRVGLLNLIQLTQLTR